jgi:nicotinate-nucleotide adenylyltransferase
VKLGLFGGSFDPIHRGHLEPVQAARRELGLDRVVYLPTARPPHKPGRAVAPPLARYAMVELALLAEEGLFASPHELTLERPAYTVETLLHFRDLHPGAALHLLLGADSFAELHLWVRWREILELARLVVLARPGAERERLLAQPPPALAAAAPDGVVFVDNPPVAVSSTELREAFARGERPPEGTVPELVVKYVKKYGLYR